MTAPPALLQRLLRSNRLLFWLPVLIWGTTWHVILYQLREVSAPVAVAWRFALAATLFFALAAAQGQRLRWPLSRHFAMAGIGGLQYGLNYWGVYEAERHIPSGLVAVLFALMVFGNALLGWWGLKQPVTRRFLAAGAVGVLGVALVFWPEVAAARAAGGRAALLGLAIGLGAVTAACLGNVFTLRLTRQGMPLLPLLAWGMAYGSAALALLSLAQGRSLAPGHSAAWWLSLLYLVVLGTVVAFFAYFKLAQREGPARAALTGVLTPVVALVASAALEGWQPTLLSVAGVALALASVYAATRPVRSAGA